MRFLHPLLPAIIFSSVSCWTSQSSIKRQNEFTLTCLHAESFAITPQKGWERPTKICDGGPGGSGAGGDLKTDYVVVPTATMVATESCFDQTKIPFPTTYAQQRRMAQRFDQSLIMEVNVVEIATMGALGSVE